MSTKDEKLLFIVNQLIKEYIFSRFNNEIHPWLGFDKNGEKITINEKYTDNYD
jgi:hypothetical protein